MLTRRTLLATGAAATALAASPAAAAPISLGRLSRYLNSVQTAEGEFTQISQDGAVSTGTVYIQRPGRVRFDYDPPDETLVMAGGGQVAVFDGRSNSGRPEQYPLSRTPLNLILRENVNLGAGSTVAGHRQDGPRTIVTARDPQNPEYGQIELVFTDNPVQLRQWVITDGSGARTTVVLGDFRTGVDVPSSYFSIQTEINRRS